MKPLLAVLTLASCLAALDSLSASEFHVSPQGDDRHPGTAAQPLRTLQAGVNRLQPGDTLLLGGGIYRETVTFPRSGEPGKPLTLRPAGPEPVVVSGCDALSGWTLHDATARIWKAPMPWTLGPGRNQLFSGGSVLLEARFPNTPAPGLEMYVSGLSPLWPAYGEFSIPRETRVSRPGRIVSKLLDGQPEDYWKGALYCGVHFEGWCAQTGIIERSAPGEIEVGDRTQGWWFGSAYEGKFPQDHEAGRGMIVGHLHALDQPGEWHWQDQTVYLIAPGDGEPRGLEAKRRPLAFDLSHREHIRIEGLAIQAASLRLEHSAHCVVERCHISYPNHYTHHLNAGQIEKGRDTLRSGETGIYVSGHDNSFLHCSVRHSAGAGFYLRGFHHTIHNCLIDETAYVGHYLNAITDAVGDFPEYENFLVGGHCITFNTMRNAGRHFFNFYGNGTSLASRNRGPMDYAATLFAHNHVYNGMLLTRDAGFLTGYFGSGGTLNGRHSQVIYNVMHDNYDLSAMRWNKLGIVYLDEGTCHVDLHHNLLWAAPGSNQRDMWFNTCCVGIRERDNVFHGLFTRSSATLQDEDFPGGKPFRFGHDFEHPPALPRWPQFTGKEFPAAGCSPRAEGIVSEPDALILKDGDWFALDPVDFDQDWGSAVLRFASDLRELNNDRSSRATPRHRKATDPLVLEAKYSDGAAETLRRQWTFVHHVQDGAWLRFDEVPLGAGYGRFRAIYGNEGAAPWRLEVRLDAVDGPLAGQTPLPQSDRERGGHVQIYGEAVAELSPAATGTRTVYLVFRSESGKPVVDFEYFRFERYRGELPLLKNEVKLELRAGSKDGPKLGELYPRSTGGAAQVRELVTPLEPARGTQPLYVVVRSALAKPIGRVCSLRLEKSAEPLDWTGIGIEPRRSAGGWIFPEPTHRPCAQPADVFRQPLPNRPLLKAPALAAAPVLDGSLAEWTGRPLLLPVSLEGVPLEGPAPEVWTGQHGKNLYVALRCPVPDPRKEIAAGHRWGASDGVEIALQDREPPGKGPVLTLRGWPDGHLAVPDVAGVPGILRQQLVREVRFRAATGGDHWCGEWCIPLAACGWTGDKPALLACNFTVRNESQNSWHSWKADGGASYDLHNGGTLILGTPETLLTTMLKESLEVWLDAAADATLERDAEGRVTAWLDRSGKSRHARQSSPGVAPRFDPQGCNGLPALRFDGTRQTRMEVPDLASGPIDATVIAVVSNPEAGPPGAHNLRIFTASDGKQYDYLCGLACGVPGTETGGPRLMTFEGRNRWARNVRVGCFSPIYHTFFHGQIGEILVFARALAPEEKARVLGYLTAKWNL